MKNSNGGESMNSFEIGVSVIVLIIMVGGFVASQVVSRMTEQSDDTSNE